MSIVSIRGFSLFSGTSNLPLSEKVAKNLGINLGKIEIIRFKDRECRIWIQEEVRGKNVYVLQSLSNPVDENLMEMALIGDAIKRGGAATVTAIVPYYGYARQDRAHRVGEPISARVVAKIIEAVGFDEVVTIDMHTDAIMGFFKIPMMHIFGLSVLVNRVKKEFGGRMREVVVVAPDVGGVKRARNFASKIDVPIVVIEKERELNKLHEVNLMEVIGDPKGKSCIIVDDMITTGLTIAHSAEALIGAGAKKVYVCVTHADFVPETKKILSKAKVEKVFVTDSIDIPKDLRFPKLEVVSISHLLSDTIKSQVS